MPELNSLLACPAKSGLFAPEKGTHFTEMLRKRAIFFPFFLSFLSSSRVLQACKSYERWIHMALRDGPLIKRIGFFNGRLMGKLMQDSSLFLEGFIFYC